jgi:hypothetical protein
MVDEYVRIVYSSLKAVNGLLLLNYFVSFNLMEEGGDLQSNKMTFGGVDCVSICLFVLSSALESLFPSVPDWSDRVWSN